MIVTILRLSRSPDLFGKVFLMTLQGRRKGFQSGGAMEHWKVLSATMVGRQEKVLNSWRSRMPKIVTFCTWWQAFNNFCFETLSFFLCFTLFLLLCKQVGGFMPPGPTPCHRPCKWNICSLQSYKYLQSSPTISNSEGTGQKVWDSAIFEIARLRDS